MKKKIFSFVLAVCLIVPCMFMLTACGSSFKGLYEVRSMVVGETTYTWNEQNSVEGVAPVSYISWIRIEGKGVCRVGVYSGTFDIDVCTWEKVNDNTITIKPTSAKSEADYITATISDGILSFTTSGFQYSFKLNNN